MNITTPNFAMPKNFYQTHILLDGGKCKFQITASCGVIFSDGKYPNEDLLSSFIDEAFEIIRRDSAIL